MKKFLVLVCLHTAMHAFDVQQHTQLKVALQWLDEKSVDSILSQHAPVFQHELDYAHKLLKSLNAKHMALERHILTSIRHWEEFVVPISHQDEFLLRQNKKLKTIDEQIRTLERIIGKLTPYVELPPYELLTYTLVAINPDAI